MSLALDRHGLAKHLRHNAVTPTDHFVPPTMLGWAAPPPVVQDLEQRARCCRKGHHGTGCGRNRVEHRFGLR